MKKKAWIVIAISVIIFIMLVVGWIQYQVIQGRLDLAAGESLNLEIGGGRNAIGFALMKRNCWVEADGIFNVDDIGGEYGEVYIAKNSKGKFVLALSQKNAQDLVLPNSVKEVSENMENAPSVLYIEPDYNAEYMVEWFIPRYIVGGVPRCLNNIKDWINRYIF